MAANRIPNYLGRLMVACLAVTGLMASEYHGVVQSNGLPVPGATVTAVSGDKKQATTTDENGAFSFPEADGLWTIQVDMLGFVKFSKEVAVAANAPAPTFELKPMTSAELKTALAPPPPPPTAPATAAAPTATAAAAPASGTAASPSGTKPAATTAQNSNGAGNRPSIRAAQAGRGGGFTRLD